ncbi:hypothetical protein [Tenacibaculum soleae]|uniref:hypothetical protein n=1 Tax=Tenacibaculum soleae TaxID=447689 RepID=UPI002301BBE3|nr:hypothetical protein [Tenacibaculum soleae]
MSEVIDLDNGDYVGVAQDSSLNYYEISGRENSSGGSSKAKQSFHNWDENVLELDNYSVIPNGANNDNPKVIQETTLPNSIAPRIQNRKVELLVDQFPYLYEETADQRVAVDKPEIKEWLESFNYIDELIANATDYYYSNIVFTKVFREIGARFGLASTSFAKIENVSSFDARLAYRKSDKRKVPTHVVIGDWYSGNSSDSSGFQVYPIYNPLEPTKYPVSIHVVAFRSYGMKKYYPLPEIWGALPWIERNTAIPQILKSLTENSLNIKWHITSPSSFWEAKRKALQDEYKNKTENYEEKMLEDLRKSILGKLSELLSGVENVGKFWHNVEVTKIVGATAHKEGWEIKPIEQKVKDYVKAQLEVALASAKFVLSSLGLHSALANVGADGKSDSGSEQIYAYKIHQYTSTRMAEYYVCKALNDIIKQRFNENVKVGFKRAKIDTEAETQPKRRLKNQEED